MVNWRLPNFLGHISHNSPAKANLRLQFLFFDFLQIAIINLRVNHQNCFATLFENEWFAHGKFRM